jgi:hypothetical protein
MTYNKMMETLCPMEGRLHKLGMAEGLERVIPSPSRQIRCPGLKVMATFSPGLKVTAA